MVYSCLLVTNVCIGIPRICRTAETVTIDTMYNPAMQVRPVYMGAIVCTTLAAGLVSGLVIHGEHPFSRVHGDCSATFPLTSRSLDCTDYDISSTKMDALDTKLTQAIALSQKEGKVTRASIWVRDLETKQYAAVNEFETYEPASLLKLPLAIAYLKYSEIRPAVMDMQFSYSTPQFLDETYNFFTASTTLLAGTNYATSDLLGRLLRYSDNGAHFTLLDGINKEFYDQVLLDLGIKIPTDDNVFDFVTVKTYANIFRSLYNASYLTRANAQQILGLLSQSDFEGIAAGVPATTPVAHKFGERSFFSKDGKALSKELHDCGIVYKGEYPYSICVMTSGTDFETLRGVIKDLSNITHDNI